MKKFLLVFLVTQMAIIMYIFNIVIFPAIYYQSIFDGYNRYIYVSPDKYSSTMPDNPISNSFIYETLTSNGYDIMLINYSKSEDGIHIIDIYQNTNNVFDLDNFSSDYNIIYHDLNSTNFYSDYMSFYTNADIDFLNNIDPCIEFYSIDTNFFDLAEITYFHILFGVILCIISFIVLFIYTILDNKEHAIKTMLGFSKSKIILSDFKSFTILQLIAGVISLVILTIYYIINKHFSIWYIFFCLLSFIILSIFNFTLLFLSQFVIKSTMFIDMLKNKTFSKSFSYFLTFSKIIIILFIFLFTDFTSTVIHDYNTQKQTLKTHSYLDNYKCINTLNNNFLHTLNNQDSIEKIMQDGKKLYNELNEDGSLMYFYSETLNQSNYNDNSEDVESHSKSFRNNYIVINNNYAKKFLDVYDLENNKRYFKERKDKPYLLIPEEYKDKENSIKNTYMHLLNNSYYNYTDNSYLAIFSDLYDFSYDDSSPANQLEYIDYSYISDYEMNNIIHNNYYLDEISSLHNPIIIVLEGDFDEDFYINSLLSDNVFFSSSDNTNNLTNCFAKYDFGQSATFSSLNYTIRDIFNEYTPLVELIYITDNV